MPEYPLMFFKGIALGFAIALGIGPISILCIQQTLSNGLAAGLAVGIGAAFADGLLAAIAGIGLTFVTAFLIGHQFWIYFLGGIFLCYLGIVALQNARRNITFTHEPEVPNLALLCGSTILLTLANPVTLISFSALLASINIENPGYSPIFYAGSLFVSFFIGSFLWWLLLSGGISLFRSRFSVKTIELLRYITGFILIGFGLLAFLKALVG